jgi:two-component system, LytTR family, sensor histidine kinase AgrC
VKHLLLLKLFVILLIGIFIIVFFEICFLPEKLYTIMGIISISTLVLWLSSIYFLRKLSSLLVQDKINQETDRLYLEEGQKLIQVLQSQRHDYRNELQVIRGLAQMNKVAAIIQYINHCNQALDLSGAIPNQIQNPIISALLLALMTEAKDQGIAFHVDCELDFACFNLPAVKITRIFGNVVQNAIEILECSDFKDRSIQVTLWETTGCYNFSIWNNGPVIPEDIQERIFNTGFSTKSSSGLGLAIVKDLVNELNGKVTVSSSLEKGTEFKVMIPKKN